MKSLAVVGCVAGLALTLATGSRDAQPAWPNLDGMWAPTIHAGVVPSSEQG